MKKRNWLAFLAVLVLAAGSVMAARAEIIPAEGVGQYGMGAVVLIAPGLFEKLGGALLGCLGGLVLCEIVLLLCGVRQTVIDWVASGLFALYIGYDIHRSQKFVKTVDNAVDSALDIYMDIANLFLRLLSLMSKKND